MSVMNKEFDFTEDMIAKAHVIGPEAFTSEAYVRAEAGKLWPKVWQQACRVEEIPNVGDYAVYDILDDTILVVRSAADEISAFYNVCAHRGRRLVDGCGHASHFHCRYHAWQYNLKGENIRVLDKDDWDGALKPERLNLPEVKVDTWGGWVWINMDPSCVPLRAYLEPLASLFDPFAFEKMRYRWRLWSTFDCNWKVALEAFMEAYHVEGTHPQLVNYADFYTWSTTDGLHSHKGFRERKAHLNTLESSSYFRPGKGDDARISIAKLQQETYSTVNASTTQTMVDAAKRLVDELPEGTPADKVTAHWLASAKRDDAARGVIWPSLTSEQLAKAGNSCHIFPNFAMGYGFTFALCYRTRPYGFDPNKCIFEAYVIERFPEGKEPKTEWVYAKGNDPVWRPVLPQDFQNMPEVQRGMRCRGYRGALPNPKQEQPVSNLHRNLAKFMGIGAPRPLK
jgi:phenylpropionate dioxygenase-like ring-hydroxylating dioxygenase large terminal subunit